MSKCLTGAVNILLHCLCTLTVLYIHTHFICTHTLHLFTHIYTEYTHAHTLTYNHYIRCCYSVYHISWCLITLPLYISTSIPPVSLHIVNMVLELTLYIVYLLLVLFLFLIFLPYVVFRTTFILITALFGLGLARKAFHCTCARDIKTGNFKPPHGTLPG